MPLHSATDGDPRGLDGGPHFSRADGNPNGADGATHFLTADDVPAGERQCAFHVVDKVQEFTEYPVMRPALLGNPAGSSGVPAEMLSRAVGGQWKESGYKSPQEAIDKIGNGGMTILSVQMDDSGAHAALVIRSATGEIAIHEQIGSVTRVISGDTIVETLLDDHGNPSVEYTLEAPDAVGQWLSKLSPHVTSTHGIPWETDEKGNLVPTTPLEPGQYPDIQPGDAPTGKIGYWSPGAATLDRPAEANPGASAIDDFETRFDDIATHFGEDPFTAPEDPSALGADFWSTEAEPAAADAGDEPTSPTSGEAFRANDSSSGMTREPTAEAATPTVTGEHASAPTLDPAPHSTDVSNIAATQGEHTHAGTAAEERHAEATLGTSTHTSPATPWAAADGAGSAPAQLNSQDPTEGTANSPAGVNSSAAQGTTQTSPLAQPASAAAHGTNSAAAHMNSPTSPAPSMQSPTPWAAGLLGTAHIHAPAGGTTELPQPDWLPARPPTALPPRLPSYIADPTNLPEYTVDRPAEHTFTPDSTSIELPGTPPQTPQPPTTRMVDHQPTPKRPSEPVRYRPPVVIPDPPGTEDSGTNDPQQPSVMPDILPLAHPPETSPTHLPADPASPAEYRLPAHHEADPNPQSPGAPIDPTTSPRLDRDNAHHNTDISGIPKITPLPQVQRSMPLAPIESISLPWARASAKDGGKKRKKPASPEPATPPPPMATASAPGSDAGDAPPAGATSSTQAQRVPGPDAVRMAEVIGVDPELVQRLPGGVRQAIDLVECALRDVIEQAREESPEHPMPDLPQRLPELGAWIGRRLTYDIEAQNATARIIDAPPDEIDRVRGHFQQLAGQLDQELAAIVGLPELGIGEIPADSTDPLHELRRISRRPDAPAPISDLVQAATAFFGLTPTAVAMEPIYRTLAEWPFPDQADAAIAIAWGMLRRMPSPQGSAEIDGPPGNRTASITVTAGPRQTPVGDNARREGAHAVSFLADLEWPAEQHPTPDGGTSVSFRFFEGIGPSDTASEAALDPVYWSATEPEAAPPAPPDPLATAQRLAAELPSNPPVALVQGNAEDGDRGIAQPFTEIKIGGTKYDYAPAHTEVILLVHGTGPADLERALPDAFRTYEGLRAAAAKMVPAIARYHPVAVQLRVMQGAPAGPLSRHGWSSGHGEQLASSLGTTVTTIVPMDSGAKEILLDAQRAGRFNDRPVSVLVPAPPEPAEPVVSIGSRWRYTPAAIESPEELALFAMNAAATFGTEEIHAAIDRLGHDPEAANVLHCRLIERMSVARTARELRISEDDVRGHQAQISALLDLPTRPLRDDDIDDVATTFGIAGPKQPFHPVYQRLRPGDRSTGTRGDILIRDARPGDLQDIVRCHGEGMDVGDGSGDLLGFVLRSLAPRKLQERMADIHLGDHVLVAEAEDGTVVGWIQIGIPKGNEEAGNNGVYIRPGWQRHGIGKRLVDTANSLVAEHLDRRDAEILRGGVDSRPVNSTLAIITDRTDLPPEMSEDIPRRQLPDDIFRHTVNEGIPAVLFYEKYGFENTGEIGPTPPPMIGLGREYGVDFGVEFRIQAPQVGMTYRRLDPELYKKVDANLFTDASDTPSAEDEALVNEIGRRAAGISHAAWQKTWRADHQDEPRPVPTTGQDWIRRALANNDPRIQLTTEMQTIDGREQGVPIYQADIAHLDHDEQPADRRERTEKSLRDGARFALASNLDWTDPATKFGALELLAELLHNDSWLADPENYSKATYDQLRPYVGIDIYSDLSKAERNKDRPYIKPAIDALVQKYSPIADGMGHAQWQQYGDRILYGITRLLEFAGITERSRQQDVANLVTEVTESILSRNNGKVDIDATIDEIRDAQGRRIGPRGEFGIRFTLTQFAPDPTPLPHHLESTLENKTRKPQTEVTADRRTITFTVPESSRIATPWSTPHPTTGPTENPFEEYRLRKPRGNPNTWVKQLSEFAATGGGYEGDWNERENKIPNPKLETPPHTGSSASPDSATTPWRPNQPESPTVPRSAQTDSAEQPESAAGQSDPTQRPSDIDGTEEPATRAFDDAGTGPLALQPRTEAGSAPPNRDATAAPDPQRSAEWSRNERITAVTQRPLPAAPVDVAAHRGPADLGTRIEASLLVEDKFRVPLELAGDEHPETAFGERNWANHLAARRYARDYGKRDLTVEFMQGIHRLLSAGSDEEAFAGVLNPGGDRHWASLERPLTAAEQAAVADNPRLTYVPPFDGREFGIIVQPVDGVEGIRRVVALREPPTRELLDAIEAEPMSVYHTPEEVDFINKPNGVILYRRSVDAAELRARLQDLCDRYNEVRLDPTHDPCELAAGLRRDLVSIPPFRDFNGRTAGTLVNWSLENDGYWPSAVREPDLDILTLRDVWTEAIREGSVRYGRWATKHDALQGRSMNSIEFFDLGPTLERKRSRGLSIDLFDGPRGALLNHIEADRLAAQLGLADWGRV